MAPGATNEDCLDDDMDEIKEWRRTSRRDRRSIERPFFRGNSSRGPISVPPSARRGPDGASLSAGGYWSPLSVNARGLLDALKASIENQEARRVSTTIESHAAELKAAKIREMLGVAQQPVASQLTAEMLAGLVPDSLGDVEARLDAIIDKLLGEASRAKAEEATPPAALPLPSYASLPSPAPSLAPSPASLPRSPEV